jgi:hypothetical protein
MARLSKAELTWWEAQAEQQTCSRCGKQGTKAYVQPQYDDRHGAALCVNCIALVNAEIRAQRKAQLAREPRCVVAGCKARGAFYVGHSRTLLCAKHKRAALRNAPSGPFWLPMAPTTTEDVIRWATQ